MVKEVPPRVVEKVWDKITKMSRPATTKLMEQMGREQPVVLVYLDSVDEESLNEGERGILAYLGMFIWQAMKQTGGYLPRVTEDAMIQAEVATVIQFENLDPQQEDALDAVNAILHGCGQAELMDFALVALMEAAGLDKEDEGAEEEEAGEALEDDDEDEENEEDDDAVIRAENVPLLIMNLKTVVDVLNV